MPWGPVWSGGNRGEPDLLRSTYRATLSLAREHDAQTAAFPAISCGAYRFPIREAARIAVREVAAFLEKDLPPLLVTLCCFEPRVRTEYERVLAEVDLEA